MKPDEDPTATRFDRLIEGVTRFFSPKAALLRAHHRRMAKDGDYGSAFRIYAHSRGYAAAKTTTNSTPWLNESDRSADAEIVQDQPYLRNRHRALERDEPVASGIFREFRRGVIGTGLRPQVRIPGEGNETKNEALEAVGREALARSASHYGYLDGMMQAIEYQATIEAGHVLLRPAIDAPGQPMWIEVIEADRLATPMDALPEDPMGRIVAGVEKDGLGRPVAYWIAKRHPHDVPANTVYGPKAWQAGAVAGIVLAKAFFDRCPIGDPGDPQIKMVLSRVTRPGQSVGVGILHSCLQDLHDLYLLLAASLKRAQISACLAIFITSAANDLDLLEMTAADYGYQLDQKLKPGAIWRLFPGESVTTVNPTVNAPDLKVFVGLMASRIAAAIGISPQAILREWVGVNYSGARTIKIDDRQTFRLERGSYADQALTWKWRILLQDALLRGDERLISAGVTADDLRWVVWIGDEEQWVDPQGEATAIQIMLTVGLTSLQIECARLGRDWQGVIRQKLEAEKFERELRETLGLPENTSPTLLSGGDQAPAPAPSSNDPMLPPDQSTSQADQAKAA